MNKTKIISDYDLKTIAGTSASDTVVSMHNQIATNTLCDLLGVSDLATHSVTGERTKVLCDNWIEPLDFPATSIVLKNRLLQELTGYTVAAKENSARLYRVLTTDGLDAELPNKKLILEYTAGFTVRETVEITTQPSEGDKITVTTAGAAVVYTFTATPSVATDVEIGATTAETAQNLQNTTGGDVTDSTVTLPLGASSTSASAAFTITEPNIPDDLKFAVVLIATGSMRKLESAGDVSSYQVGSKRVTFRNPVDAETVRGIVDGFLFRYQSNGIAG